MCKLCEGISTLLLGGIYKDEQLPGLPSGVPPYPASKHDTHQ